MPPPKRVGALFSIPLTMDGWMDGWMGGWMDGWEKSKRKKTSLKMNLLILELYVGQLHYRKFI